MTKTNVKMNTDITAMQYTVRYTQNGVLWSPPLIQCIISSKCIDGYCILMNNETIKDQVQFKTRTLEKETRQNYCTVLSRRLFIDYILVHLNKGHMAIS